jgi:[protein-PII] uridylyltransferase
MDAVMVAAAPQSGARTSYTEQRAAAIAGFEADLDADVLLRKLSNATDQLLRSLWRTHGFDRKAALIAVGGYGRGELFPHSDVDLLIIIDAPTRTELSSDLEAFVGACWDLGLEIGHSVRSIEECLGESARDLTVQTSLLEMRPLTGSRRMFVSLKKQLATQLDPKEFFQGKMLELQQRHAKFEDTPYSLEPNTKESPGGLRDLHVIRWTALAAGYGHSWKELTRSGMLTSNEARAARRSESVIKRIRAALHICAKRRDDRLVFDLQTQAAQKIGIERQNSRQASEELMQRYFLAAKAVSQVSTIALQNLESALLGQERFEPEPIDGEFQNRQGQLDLLDPGVFERDPSSILRAFIVMQKHSELTSMTARTLRALWNSRDLIDGRFRRDARNRQLFMELLKQPRGITHALRRMNQWSILGRYLPVFRRIVGRMQHDLFHVFTVDQHILTVVRNVRRFTISDHAHEFPFCSQLIAGYEKHWLLYLAALFHDIAKGRGGDHSQLGRADVHKFCRDHQVSPEDTATAEFLVEHHLSMSSFAQKQDLSDASVIDRFAQLVGDEQRLTALYLLTVADIRGTSPKVWNAWKGKLLEDLFRATHARLTGGEQPNRQDSQRSEAIRILNLYGLSESSYADFWNTLDIGYFLRNDPQDIAWHTRVLYTHTRTEKPIVRCRLAAIGEGFHVVVYLPDQEDLFARTCGYFDRKSVSVLDAKIHTTKRGYALDSYLVVNPIGTGNHRDWLQLVEAELTQALSERLELANPIKGRISRRSRYFPIQPKVDLRSDTRGEHFLLSVTANDRTGLLYSISRVLTQHGINLFNARVTTLGERVEDLFVVDGPSLTNLRQQLLLESDLLAVLQA